MKIINIRPYTSLNTKILDYNDEEVIFAKDYTIKGKYYYCISSYKVKTNTVEEICRYEIPESEFYSQYIHIIGEEIIIIKMHFTHKIEVDILSKINKETKSKHSIEIKDEITSIPIIINRRYFIFYAEIYKINSLEYVQYKENGYSRYNHCIYLCDLLEDKIYFIKDFRMIIGLSVMHGLTEKLPTFIHDNQEYLIFNETYMEDSEYEEYIYNSMQSNKLSDSFVKEMETLCLITVNDFVETIKIGEQNIPFKMICKRYLDGWVRYFGIDEKNIYFREKDFRTQIEKIFMINKTNFESTVVIEINHKNIKGRLRYGNKIYEEIEADDAVEIRGIYNLDCNLFLKKDRNISFEEYIDGRYLITSQHIEDQEDNYYEVVYITDTKENTCNKYEGRLHIYDNYVILY